MQKTEAQQLLLKIIEYAQQNRAIEFHLITSWNDFKICRRNARATKLIIRALKASADSLFNTYLDTVKAGTQNINRLLAYSKLQSVLAFYEKDLTILQQMLDEYDTYLGQGHFWYSFLGGERET